MTVFELSAIHAMMIAMGLYMIHLLIEFCVINGIWKWLVKPFLKKHNVIA